MANYAVHVGCGASAVYEIKANSADEAEDIAFNMFNSELAGLPIIKLEGYETFEVRKVPRAPPKR